MKNIIIIIVAVIAAYVGYTKFAGPANNPYETYKTFTSLINETKYNEALNMTEGSASTEDSLKSRQGWFRMLRIEKITQTVNDVVSQSMSTDGHSASFEINQRAWVVPGTTAPAFPDYLFKHNVVLKKDENSLSGWIVSEFLEEIESLGKR